MARTTNETPRPRVGEASDPYRALRIRDFRLLLMGACLSFFGTQMLGVAIGWELYVRTASPLVLGGVGLAQVIPVILLSLPAGYVADRYDRRRIMLFTQGTVAVGAVLLAVFSAAHAPLASIYGVLMLTGAASAFNNPASSALIGQVLPPDLYENAVTWRSSVTQVSAILGPAVGGLLIGVLGGATFVYLIYAAAALAFVALLAQIRPRPQERPADDGSKRTWRAVGEGLQFLWRTPVLLAAITLDLFAVLLGGAVTLLPIFAQDILNVGPLGLGWLRAAGSIGAVLMAYVLARRPAFAHAGRTLLFAVVGFGVATVIFGLSRNFWLSFAMLFLIGAFDNVSVVIRSTLVLVRTPDAMRGRVGSVNSLFISTSNQLGGFESGATAQLFGPVAATVAGGIGTILVVFLVAWLWPEMRDLRTLRDAPAEAEAEAEAATGAASS